MYYEYTATISIKTMILLIVIVMNLMTRTTSLLSRGHLSRSRNSFSVVERRNFCRFYSKSGAQNDGDSEDVKDNSSAFHANSHSLQHSGLKHRLRNGLHLTGVVSGQYRDTDHVEMLGLLGYDFLWADAEHSSASPDDISAMILAAERRGLPTIVRVGYGYQNIIGHIQKYLVSGAQGILLPQCDSREDVEKVVKAVKFPPIGERGLAGERWNAWGLARDPASSDNLPLSKCIESANQNSIVGVLMENQAGLDALDEIMTVPELDMIFLAPTDLSCNMGLHGQIRHPEVLKKIEDAGKKIQQFNDEQGEKTGKIAVGTLALTGEDYKYWRERNFQVLCGVAQCMFVDGAKDFLDKVQDYERRRTK